MEKAIKNGHDLCQVTLTASRTHIHVCDIVTSQIRAGSLKMDEHQQDEHEEIEKKGGHFLHFEWYSSKSHNQVPKRGSEYFIYPRILELLYRS